MKNNKFIDYNSTIIDVEELVYANIEERVVTMIFKNSPLSVKLRFKTEEEALVFIRKIFNAGKRDIDKPKRKRGRPRKYTSLEVKLKRPVGRPRKNKE